MKEIALEECPYHHIKPWQLACIDISTRYFLFDSNEDEVDFRTFNLGIFKDAMLFCHGCTVFCPECAKSSPTPDKHNKFGYGFCSQYSLQEAKRNWNNAVRRFAKRSIREVLEGKAK